MFPGNDVDSFPIEQDRLYKIKTKYKKWTEQ
jgi:hypothetical protein